MNHTHSNKVLNHIINETITNKLCWDAILKKTALYYKSQKGFLIFDKGIAKLSYCDSEINQVFIKFSLTNKNLILLNKLIRNQLKYYNKKLIIR